MSCKPWSKSLRPDGYGEVRIDGKTVRAHRLAYANAHGLGLEDIKGAVVRHTCDNPSCVNPHHLVLGSHFDNAQDRVERDRGAKGERQGSAKLRTVDIPQIRQLLMKGVPQRTIAKSFGVAQSQIGAIKSGKTWRHV
ncbi:HNH endonuclease [Caballeronia sp. LZ003]|uniref:HNH endonuclease n=1 Tax=unclassified Caballeronia TaxID=2646786 RepID=UPI0038575C26